MFTSKKTTSTEPEDNLNESAVIELRKIRNIMRARQQALMDEADHVEKMCKYMTERITKLGGVETSSTTGTTSYVGNKGE